MIHLWLAATLVAFQAAAPEPAASPADDVVAEIHRSVVAYNAQDMSYYETALAPDAVFIADDGAVFPGKAGVLAVFRRIFERTPPAQLAVSDVQTGRRGDVAWTRVRWTVTAAGARPRSGVATTLFARSGERWQILSIQNTPSSLPSPSSGPPAPER